MVLKDVKGALALGAILVFVVSVSTAPVESSGDTLQLLQLLVRHGNRSALMAIPGREAQYEAEFAPFLYGGLLPEGRRQMAEVGSYIRNRYDWFLPKEFTYAAVTSKCAGVQRVQESAAVFVSSIFPPVDTKQQWQDAGMGYYTIPIPCLYVPESQDTILGGNAATCPRFSELYANVLTSDAFKEELNDIVNNGQFYEDVARGMNISQPASFNYSMSFVENLYTSAGSSVQIPDWAWALYPQSVEIARFHQSLNFFNEEMTRILMGEFLMEIFDYAEKVQNNEIPSSQKLVSYLAHDTQIMAMIKMFNLKDTAKEVNFGAALIMELYRNQTTSKVGYKFVFRNYSWLDPEVLTVPGCGEICPLEYLRNYVKNYIPTQSRSEYCQSIPAW